MKAKTHSKALNKFLAFIGVSALALVLAMGLTGCSGDALLKAHPAATMRMLTLSL